MATHSSILAWRIPWTEEPGGLQSMDSQRVGHNWVTNTQLSSVQLLSRVQLFPTQWEAACQASLTLTNSWSLLKLMSIELVMPSKHLILCHPHLLPPSIFPSIKVFKKIKNKKRVFSNKNSLPILIKIQSNWQAMVFPSSSACLMKMTLQYGFVQFTSPFLKTSLLILALLWEIGVSSVYQLA